MNFAYDRVVDGKGVNRPFKDMRPFLKSRGIDSDYIKRIEQVLGSPELEKNFLKRVKALNHDSRHSYDRRIANKLDILGFYNQSIKLNSPSVTEL